LYSSMIVRNFTVLPPWVVSKTTSTHQTSLTAVAFTFASGRRGTLGRRAGPVMAPSKRGYRFPDLHLPRLRRPQHVGPTGARQPTITARLTLRTHARRYHALGGVAPLRRAYLFFEFTSFSTWMFRTWSATIRFKRAFSSLRAFNSFSSSISIAPYCCFQRWSVASLIFTSRATACADSPPSIRRRIATICSGVCFFPFGIWVPFLEPRLSFAMAQFWYVRSPH